MIRKIRVRGFKKFADQEFEIPSRLMVTGPNNSGKTSLLQAVGAWTEIAFRWSQENPDLAREADGNYPATGITIQSFVSIPVANFDHLWSGKKTDEPLTVWLDTDRWSVGFEFLHEAQAFIVGRPAAATREEDLAALRDDFRDAPGKSGRPWRPVYIPAVSGVGPEEHRFADQEAIQSYLAKANAGNILRNLLWQVQENRKWGDLSEAVDRFFPGYELMPLSSGEHILAQYRHPAEAAAYDLSSAASGFLQVLLIYAAILGRSSAVYLLDEPDAHLHISLQNPLLDDLLARAERDGFQVIEATHSERLLREAPADCLYLLDARGDLKKVPGGKAVAALRLDPVEIAEAFRTRRLLYLEGGTDIKFLRIWAKTLAHSSLPFLERTTPKTTAEQEGKERLAVKHFAAMRELVPELRGVELLDGDRRGGDRKMPDGLALLFWRRKEIESYLLHPASILRYLNSIASPEDAGKARQSIRLKLPPEVFESPRGEQLFLEGFPIKDFFSGLFQEAGRRRVTNEDYFRMAEQMKAEEIPEEVCEKLNQIADHLGIREGAAGAA